MDNLHTTEFVGGEHHGVTSTLSSKEVELDQRKEELVGLKQQLISCKDLNAIKVIKVLGIGKKKCSFEVILPNGEVAVAKRAISYLGVRNGVVQREAYRMKILQDMYGRESPSVAFLGECNLPLHKSYVVKGRESPERRANLTTYYESIAHDFAEGGFTLFTEKGTPFIQPSLEWQLREKKINCFANIISEQHLEDFRAIARKYAGYQKNGITSIALGDIHKHVLQNGNDNSYLQQYVMTSAGVKHIDLDQIVFHNANSPPVSYDDVLNFNCHTLDIATFGNGQTLNCSLAYSQNHPVSQDEEQVGKFFNATEVEQYCMKMLNHEGS